MLAAAPKHKITEAVWAPISGFAASLPATVHDLVDAYSGATPKGLSLTRLIDVAVTAVFLGLSAAMLFRRRSKTAEEILQEILNPGASTGATRAKRWWEFWRR